MQFLMFSKMLGPLNVTKAGEVIKNLGFDGVDLTVRPGGHVLPHNVAKDLRRAIETLQSIGLTVPMITTSITDARDDHAEDIFDAAAESDVRFLKLGYWPYEGFGTIHKAISDTRKRLSGIETLAQKFGVKACIHSHSANNLSAEGGVVYMLLQDFDPHALGAYIDPGHMTAEGGLSGWKICMDLLKDSISLVAAKSFGWFHEDGEWKAKLMPLQEGTVRWNEVFACLKQIGYDNIVSVHSEYQGSHSWRDLNLDELIDQTKIDLTYLKSVWQGV